MFKFGSREPEFEHLRLVLAHRAPPPRIALFAIPLSEALLEDFHGAPSPWVLPFAFLADLG